MVHSIELLKVDCCKIMLQNKKIGNPNNNKGNDQVENKKTTTSNKTMQTQKRGKWTRYKWIVAKKCFQKQNKKQKPKQQVKNKKTTTKNRTTQTKTNNTGNEHDRSSKPIFFTSKYSLCNFSTFDTTCVNCHKRYRNKYPPANIKKPQ